MITASDENKENQNTVTDTKRLLSYEIEATIVPLLNRLKENKIDQQQARQLINIIEINLQHLMQAYGNAASLAWAYQRLTPVEILVACMVRQGLSSDEIADTLAIASGTVSIHRKHIRKKLGLLGKAANLRSYLLSLTE